MAPTRGPSPKGVLVPGVSHPEGFTRSSLVFRSGKQSTRPNPLGLASARLASRFGTVHRFITMDLFGTYLFSGGSALALNGKLCQTCVYLVAVCTLVPGPGPRSLRPSGLGPHWLVVVLDPCLCPPGVLGTSCWCPVAVGAPVAPAALGPSVRSPLWLLQLEPLWLL